MRLLVFIRVLSDNATCREGVRSTVDLEFYVAWDLPAFINKRAAASREGLRVLARDVRHTTKHLSPCSYGAFIAGTNKSLFVRGSLELALVIQRIVSVVIPLLRGIRRSKQRDS